MAWVGRRSCQGFRVGGIRGNAELGERLVAAYLVTVISARPIRGRARAVRGDADRDRVIIRECDATTRARYGYHLEQIDQARRCGSA